MRRILPVTTSSLGDIIHNLPAASDIAAVMPAAQVDWVVEEAFAAIPALHPAVGRGHGLEPRPAMIPSPVPWPAAWLAIPQGAC